MATPIQRAPRRRAKARVSGSAIDFLELFYPVHYKIGIGIEDALRGGRFTRHQVAILWLIRSEGEGGREIRRKDIERTMRRWFEISNPAITKALRALARGSQSLLEIRGHPTSGREKVVRLTARGEKILDAMEDRGREFIQRMTNHLTYDQARGGVDFLRRVSAIIEIVRPARP